MGGRNRGMERRAGRPYPYGGGCSLNFLRRTDRGRETTRDRDKRPSDKTKAEKQQRLCAGLKKSQMQ